MAQGELTPSPLIFVPLAGLMLGLLSGWLTSLKSPVFQLYAQQPWKIFWLVGVPLAAVPLTYIVSRGGNDLISTTAVYLVAGALLLLSVTAIQGLRVTSLRRRWLAVVILFGWFASNMLQALGTFSLHGPTPHAFDDLYTALTMAPSWALGSWISDRFARWLGAPPPRPILRPADEPLRRFSVIAVVILSLVTAGIYIPIWFLQYRRGLNALDSARKLGVVGPITLLVLQLAFIGVPENTTPHTILRLAVLVMVGVLTFRVRFILIDHMTQKIAAVIPVSGSLQSSATPSALLTLFFSIAYLQHRINRFIDESRAWSSPAREDTKNLIACCPWTQLSCFANTGFRLLPSD